MSSSSANPNSSTSSPRNGCISCSCCPYGYHIDVDFVRYCEALLAALYGNGNNNHNSKKLTQSFINRTTHSLPLRRRVRSISGAINNNTNHHSSLSPAPASAADAAFLYLCDYNYNTNVMSRMLKNQCPSGMIMKGQSPASLLPETFQADNSLGDAVARFEETLLESRKRHTVNGNYGNGFDNTAIRQPYSLTIESPPASPAPSSCASSSQISKVVLSQIRDQMAVSLARMKELEDQVKDMPTLRQRVIVLREEKKKLLRKLDGDCDTGDNISDPMSMFRIRELEKSGLITPPVMRRKFLKKYDSDSESEEFDEFWTRTSPQPSTLISSKNIRLEEINGKHHAINQTSLQSLNMISVSTNTDFEFPSFVDTIDTATNTDTKLSRLKVNVLDSAISILPEAKSPPILTPQVASMRSIGISTNLAPSLPRKSIGTVTDLKSHDTVSLRELELRKPALVSWGTDPISANMVHVQCQAKPITNNVSVRTDSVIRKDTGINCTAKDLGIKPLHRMTQTERKSFSNKSIQVTEKCPKCDLRQTETIGVGDNDIRGILSYDKGIVTDRERPSNLNLDMSMISNVSPVSRASSAQSIRLCDKCNETITTVAKEVLIGTQEIVPSPTLHSRIPRPIHSAGPTERRTIQDKIIEETQNEILVYRNPKSLSAGSSPIKREGPPLPPPRRKEYTLKDIKIVDDVFKIAGISESDESDDDDSSSSSSSSSNECTYEVETGAIAKSRQRFEPSQEIKAALKVLNDNLLKPEKTNKSALNKSLKIIEKEWFKIAALKDSDPHTVEGYIDCFETFSKHLLNRVVNLDDDSGNTAMHYAISHNNFDIVSVLLDSKVCDSNKQNKAGYTATMLVSLAKVQTETEKAVIRRLFQLSDVNVKAKQNGQTALMLAASHGQFFTSKILLESGAAINVQDNDGSTALMCAAEHGHADVVRLLLSHPDCDPTIVDNDGSTALKIAMENGKNDIGLMLYASTSMFSRGSSPYASLRRSQSKAIAATLRRTGSFTYAHPRITSRTFQLASSPPSRSRHSSTSTVKSTKY